MASDRKSKAALMRDLHSLGMYNITRDGLGHELIEVDVDSEQRHYFITVTMCDHSARYWLEKNLKQLGHRIHNEHDPMETEVKVAVTAFQWN
jgi:hypothetical protein